MDLPSVYSPESTESKWYEVWEKQGLFGSKPDPKRPPYTIVIPPPNVTGSLHMGHALNNTLQDILIRWKRMTGHNTLWIPGTDHGGIATQNVVEKLLKKEGKTRHDLGRDAFLKRMWQWRRESGDTILYQLRKLGSACDWSRTRFTMDEPCSKAVAAAFVELYKRHLIYRGRRLVNWCPRCYTALADIEVEYQESAGKLWHIRYPFEDGSGDVVVATTRPETMLGDTAVAVNPEDPRYRGAAGKKLRLPLMGRVIPVVADPAVDPAFGTGAVKVTPSHDAADFEMGRRHDLPHEMVIGYNGKMTDRAGQYAGQSLKDCRANVLADLAAQGFLVKEEDYRHSVATCYRCQTVIEPLESSQWFMKTGDMAKRAAHATREQKRVRIFPDSWEKPYLNWLDNNRDWCISRQIWWGHQIPVWYCLACSGFTEEQLKQLSQDPAFKWESTKMILRESSADPIVREEDPVVCPRCGKEEIIRDPDVLDTWFSSALWPLTTLGWPNKTDDLAYYYPTSVLVTGHEILYLWVARMVMLGEEFGSEVPFRHVFIHGIVRDKQGRKMSKSLNNVIDPLDVMKKFGTDALRFALASSAVPGRDMQLSDDSFVGARNFANKVWNASRFVLANLSDHDPSAPIEEKLADRWILHRLEETLRATAGFIEQYDMAQAARTMYHFFWGDFCDWYIELSKVRFGGPMTKDGHVVMELEPDRRAAQRTLATVLEKSLQALHPVMPFITEGLWEAFCQTLKRDHKPLLMTSFDIPKEGAPRCNAQELNEMDVVMETVTKIRVARSEMNVPPGKEVRVDVKETLGSLNSLYLSRNNKDIERLAKVKLSPPSSTLAKPAHTITVVVKDLELYLFMEGLIDFSKEKQRLEKGKNLLESDLKRLEDRLNNPDFMERAPKEEVEKARGMHAEKIAQLKRLESHLAALGS